MFAATVALAAIAGVLAIEASAAIAQLGRGVTAAHTVDEQGDGAPAWVGIGLQAGPERADVRRRDPFEGGEAIPGAAADAAIGEGGGEFG